MLAQLLLLGGGDDDNGPEAPFDPLKYPIRLLGAQIAVATALGASALVSFCVLRKHYPMLYEPRRARRSKPFVFLLLCKKELSGCFIKSLMPFFSFRRSAGAVKLDVWLDSVPA